MDGKWERKRWKKLLPFSDMNVSVYSWLGNINYYNLQQLHIHAYRDLSAQKCIGTVNKLSRHVASYAAGISEDGSHIVILLLWCNPLAGCY